MAHWLEDAVMEGLTSMDVPEALASMSEHLAARGEWRKGVISPSLVGTSCPLARVKIFLGLHPNPAMPGRMNLRAGMPDFGSTVAMTRGFAGEALMLAALRRSLGYGIQESAPSFHIEWTDPETGTDYAGHPDVLIHADGEADFNLIQIKTPTGYKLDRVEKYGPMDAISSYLPQMATEMFICRQAGYNIVTNYLLMFSWESTPKSNRPRVKVVELPWDDSLATVPTEAAREIHQAAADALMFDRWPQAHPETSWDVWPCSYCRFSRMGDGDVPACNDHAKWKGGHGNQEIGPRRLHVVGGDSPARG